MTAPDQRKPGALRTALLLAAIGSTGLLVSFQGWQSRGPDDDVTAAMSRALTWLDQGTLPARGSLTDLNSFFPPGTSWLTLPGLLVFSDARLVEITGSGGLYLGTLAGVFLLTRRFFGTAPALLAVGLYAVSAVPLHLAGVLWPRGHPFFYVWVAYFAARWVAEHQGRFLAAAILTGSAGLYVHLELAPALLILPALWLYARPPLPATAIVVAALASLALWTPYLRFQVSRDFIDLQSQLLMRPLAEDRVPTTSWCGEEPAAAPRFLNVANAAKTPEVRVATIADLVPANLQTRVLGGDWLLLLLLVTGIVTAATGRPGTVPIHGPWTVPRSVIAGTVIVVAAEFTLRWVVAPESDLAGILQNVKRAGVWLVILLAATAGRRVRSRAEAFSRGWPAQGDARVLLIALMVPWALLLMLTEPGRADRMVGIWPLQVPFIAAITLAAVNTAAVGAIRRFVAIALVIAVVAANLVVLKRGRDWAAHGWAGDAAMSEPRPDYRFLHCP